MRRPSRKALVELAYRLDLSETDCVAQLARLCSGVFDGSEPTAVFAAKADTPLHVLPSTVASEDEALDASIRNALDWIPIELQQRFVQRPPTLCTSSELIGPDFMKRLISATGATEFAGIFCNYGRGVVGIGNRQPAPRRFSERQHREWTPVAVHIGAAWRLRDALASDPLAGLVFSADGALIDEGSALDSAPPCLREVLRRAVTQRERLRAGKEDSLWPAVVAGEWILVDRFEASGRRHVVAYACEALARPLQVLRRTESVALRRALDGAASKVIASELSVSDSTVCRLIQRALRALGLRDLADASRLRSMVHSTLNVGSGSEAVHIGVLSDRSPEAGPVPPDQIVGLTRAERDVLAAIVRGCSHRQVAAQRGTATRTVANQVASIFGKLGVGSRRELVARLVGDAPQGSPAAR